MDHFLIPFITIALAELFDKSQLAILLLSSRTKKHVRIFIGVALAFLLLTGVAVLIGDNITKFIPAILLKIIASGLFIYFGVRSLLEKPEAVHEEKKVNATVLGSFMLIFFSELGDKTQLATVTFATKYQTLSVFFGASFALILLAVLAIWVGKFIAKTEKKAIITKTAGILFIILGLTFFLL